MCNFSYYNECLVIKKLECDQMNLFGFKCYLQCLAGFSLRLRDLQIYHVVPGLKVWGETNLLLTVLFFVYGMCVNLAFVYGMYTRARVYVYTHIYTLSVRTRSLTLRTWKWTWSMCQDSATTEGLHTSVANLFLAVQLLLFFFLAAKNRKLFFSRYLENKYNKIKGFFSKTLTNMFEQVIQAWEKKPVL